VEAYKLEFKEIQQGQLAYVEDICSEKKLDNGETAAKIRFSVELEEVEKQIASKYIAMIER